MHAIRMLEDREGSPNHTHVHLYRAGEVYSRESEPPVSDDLMAGFVASGHAVEVDAAGNPVGTPADARARKAAWVAEVAALMGEPMPAAEPDAPAASASAPESAAEGDSGTVAAESASDSPADAEATGEPESASQDDDPSEDSGPARNRGRK